MLDEQNDQFHFTWKDGYAIGVWNTNGVYKSKIAEQWNICKQDGISSANTSWCFDRLIIDCLVQNQPKTYTLGFNFLSRIHEANTIYFYVWLYSGKKKGLNPLDLSLSVLYFAMLGHIKLGIWWRWRELNPRPPALRSRILHA